MTTGARPRTHDETGRAQRPARGPPAGAPMSHGAPGTLQESTPASLGSGWCRRRRPAKERASHRRRAVASTKSANERDAPHPGPYATTFRARRSAFCGRCTHTRQDLVGVLARHRRVAPTPGVMSENESGMRGWESRRAWVGDAPDRRPRRGLASLSTWSTGVHGVAGTSAFSSSFSSASRCAPQWRRHALLELGPMLHALDVVAKRGRRPCRRGRGPPPAGAKPVVGARDEHPLIVAGSGSCDRRQRRVPPSRAPSNGAASRKPSGLEVQQPERRLEQRAVHALAAAGADRAAAGRRAPERAQMPV